VFYGLQVMEDNYDEAVRVGENSRSIKFVGCNFETSPGSGGGKVIVDGNGSTLTHADFVGCQIERGSFFIGNGRASFSGGKLTDTHITLSRNSQNSDFNAVAYGSTRVLDIGFRNRLDNVMCLNMMTPIHRWP